MSDDEGESASVPLLSAQQQEQMAEIGRQAAALIAKIHDPLLNKVHGAIHQQPAHVATATLSAALADVIAHLSKTEDGATRNVLIVSEAIQRMAVAGVKRKAEMAKAN